ncbi:14879_t:CDS:2, partial [Rhizophagus irregularis]
MEWYFPISKEEKSKERSVTEEDMDLHIQRDISNSDSDGESSLVNIVTE